MPFSYGSVRLRLVGPSTANLPFTPSVSPFATPASKRCRFAAGSSVEFGEGGVGGECERVADIPGASADSLSDSVFKQRTSVRIRRCQRVEERQDYHQVLFDQDKSLPTPLTALFLHQNALRRARSDRCTPSYSLRQRAHPLSAAAARSSHRLRDAAQEARWQACQGQGRQGAFQRAFSVWWTAAAVPQQCCRRPRLMTLTARVACPPSLRWNGRLTLSLTRRYPSSPTRLLPGPTHARIPSFSARDSAATPFNRPLA